MRRIARRAWALLLAVSLMLGGLGFFLYEYDRYGSDWVFHSGSPHIYEEPQQLALGSVVDRDGSFLLNLAQKRYYSTDAALRMATLHWLGDRAGNIYTPTLNHYAQQLVGYNTVNGIYHYGGLGGQARLTLSASVQKAALAALGDRKGTVAVYNYKTGQLLCAVTTPTFDPDQIPDLSGEGYEGVYLNRFLQSVYIPGSIFKIVTTAAALEQIPDIMDQTFTCTGTYAFGPDKVTCERAHGTVNLKKAMTRSCNCAYAQIALQLGSETLQQYVARYGVTEPVRFDGITTARGNVSLQNVAKVELAWSAIGQHKDQINPCAFLTFVGAIANGGQAVAPYVVETVSIAGKTTYSASATEMERIMPQEVAELLTELMRGNVVDYYGESNFGGLMVAAKSGTGEVGGGKKPNAMFTGFVTDEEYPLAFIVCVEEGGYGRSTCIPIIAKVLEACKQVLDQNP